MASALSSAAPSCAALLSHGGLYGGIRGGVRCGWSFRDRSPAKDSRKFVRSSSLKMIPNPPNASQVWRAKSCEGLNPLSHEIEMFGYVVRAAAKRGLEEALFMPPKVEFTGLAQTLGQL